MDTWSVPRSDEYHCCCVAFPLKLIVSFQEPRDKWLTIIWWLLLDLPAACRLDRLMDEHADRCGWWTPKSSQLCSSMDGRLDFVLPLKPRQSTPWSISSLASSSASGWSSATSDPARQAQVQVEWSRLEGKVLGVFSLCNFLLK